ncbi:MAG: topoisomerase DNA-binding C4 zinc finger domain-containing protein [Atopobiaceae bacterium]|nr:topoisomerase DNA-binding C4 zinc finger domain-containing protein [Atopobiaceae bacterium]
MESTREARADYARDVRAADSGTVCPWCGSELLERNGKYGKFLGCSSFPRCRFTRNV